MKPARVAFALPMKAAASREDTGMAKPKGMQRFAGAASLLLALAGLGGCLGLPTIDRSGTANLETLGYAVPLEDAKGETRSYEITGYSAGDPDAPRLIYVHGTPGRAADFARFIRDPIPGYESIAIDRPGFGETRPRLAVTSFEEQARAIEPLLVERDGKFPILVGHSLGGPIIARAAADFPDRVGGIVILAGSLSPELESPRWYNYAANLWIVSVFLGTDLRISNREIMAGAAQTRELDGVLGRVRCPVVIVHGTEDGLVPFENVDYMLSHFTSSPSVRSVVVEGEGHFLPWTQESLVRETIENLGDSESPL